MVSLVCQRPPFWQVVCPLFLDILLRVYAMLSGKFLHDRILDFNRLDGFAEVWEGFAPVLQ
jgi:hypothetical protein